MNVSGIPAAIRPTSNYRWIICALLFIITTVNYMDRNILGVLKRTIQNDLHFSETDFGNIIFFFSIAYAIGYAGMGWLTDKIGIRLGLAAAATCGALPRQRMAWSPPFPASLSLASCSALAKAVTSPPASRRLPPGSQCAIVHLLPASSTPVAISAQ
jgi:sugar phosphate permease